MSEAGEEDPGHEPEKPQRIALHGQHPRSLRQRLGVGLGVAVLVGAAAGGITGLIGGQRAGLIAAGVVALPIVWFVICQIRRRVWLEGTTVLLRTCGSRRVDLSVAERVDVLVTEIRGARTVGFMINGHQRRNSVRIDLAVYAGDRGHELGVLGLRGLADAFLQNTEANGVVFAELLLAQLRSEARDDQAHLRPLHRLATATPSGRMVQRYPMEAVSRFVASLE